jgi:acyl carrier protein
VVELELSVLSEIRRIVTQELEWRGEVEPAHHLTRDLQLDSLGLTVLAVELENRFRIRLSVEDSVGVTTVGDLIQLVAARLEEPVQEVLMGEAS